MSAPIFRHLEVPFSSSPSSFFWILSLRTTPPGPFASKALTSRSRCYSPYARTRGALAISLSWLHLEETNLKVGSLVVLQAVEEDEGVQSPGPGRGEERRWRLPGGRSLEGGEMAGERREERGERREEKNEGRISSNTWALSFSFSDEFRSNSDMKTTHGLQS